MATMSADGKDQFDEALRLICQHDKASASLLQRRLSVGMRAGRILINSNQKELLVRGRIKPRDVLIKILMIITRNSSNPKNKLL